MLFSSFFSYFATEPEGLVNLQIQEWDPILHWVCKRYLQQFKNDLNH